MKVPVEISELRKVAQWFNKKLKGADILDRPTASAEFRSMRDLCLSLIDEKELPAKPDDSLTDMEAGILNELTERGFAVAVFTAEELDGCDAAKVEEHMISAGWSAINS